MVGSCATKFPFKGFEIAVPVISPVNFINFECSLSSGCTNKTDIACSLVKLFKIISRKNVQFPVISLSGLSYYHPSCVKMTGFHEYCIHDFVDAAYNVFHRKVIPALLPYME